MSKILSLGPVFIVFAALLWSLDGLLRTSLYSLPPAAIVFYEHFLGFIFLLFISPKWFPEIKKMNAKSWVAISIVALFSGALGTILYTAALGKINYMPYSVVVLLQQQLQPIWAISAAAILLGEKLKGRFVVLALLALLAAYMVSFPNLVVNFSTGNQTLIAGLFALTAGFCWGVSTAISKYVLNKISFIAGTAIRFFLAPVFALIILIISGQFDLLLKINQTQFLTLLTITLSTGMVALLFYYYGLKKTPAKIATICELVWPASAVLIDKFYFHKNLSLTQVIGIGFLLFIIYKISKYAKS